MDAMQLERSGLGELRIIARDVGVKYPTSKTKYNKHNRNILIEEIQRVYKIRQQSKEQKNLHLDPKEPEPFYLDPKEAEPFYLDPKEAEPFYLDPKESALEIMEEPDPLYLETREPNATMFKTYTLFAVGLVGLTFLAGYFYKDPPKIKIPPAIVKPKYRQLDTLD